MGMTVRETEALAAKSELEKILIQAGAQYSITTVKHAGELKFVKIEGSIKVKA